MAFGDSSLQSVLHELNAYLADHSYIRGFTPSKTDLTVFNALGQQLPNDFPHIQRWYRHIESFDYTEKTGWCGVTVHPAYNDDEEVGNNAKGNIEAMDTEE